MKRAWTRSRWQISIFLLVLAVHSLSPVAISGDSRWTVMVAESILDRHDTNLDEYLGLIQANQYQSVECVAPAGWIRGPAMNNCAGGHIYNWYPIGVPLLAAPAVLVIRTALHWMAPVTARLPVHHIHPVITAFVGGDMVGAFPVVEVIIASFFVALTAAILFVLAHRFLQPKYAAAIALLFAFGTSAWSMGSRALFQHTPSMFLIALTMYILVAAQRDERLVQVAGLPVAYSYLVRPTDALLVLIVTAYVFVRHRTFFVRYLLWALPVAAGFVTYNLAALGSFLPSYYSLRPELPGFTEALRSISQAMAGNLISPSRGLFVFTPVLIFSVAGMVRALRSGWMRPLSGCLAALVVLHWLLISFFVQFWWGGYSYGPRLFTDMLPVLTLFLIPILMDWQKAGAWRWSPARITFVLLAAASVLVHARGGLSLPPHKWNEYPVSVDDRPQRVWDWKDPQFLRGF